MIAAIRLRTSASDQDKNLEASEQKFGMVLKDTLLHLGPTFIKGLAINLSFWMYEPIYQSPFTI